MYTKRCSGFCKASKPLSEFGVDRSRKDGLNARCKDCNRRKNDGKPKPPRDPGEVREYAVRIKIRNQEYAWNHLKAHPCVDCGERDPVVLEFDHVRGEKVDNISRMLCSTRSLKVIQEEIAKCDVRCANCHRRRTAEDRWFFKVLWARGEANAVSKH